MQEDCPPPLDLGRLGAAFPRLEVARCPTAPPGDDDDDGDGGDVGGLYAEAREGGPRRRLSRLRSLHMAPGGYPAGRTLGAGPRLAPALEELTF